MAHLDPNDPGAGPATHAAGNGAVAVDKPAPNPAHPGNVLIHSFPPPVDVSLGPFMSQLDRLMVSSSRSSKHLGPSDPSPYSMPSLAVPSYFGSLPHWVTDGNISSGPASTSRLSPVSLRRSPVLLNEASRRKSNGSVLICIASVVRRSALLHLVSSTRINGNVDGLTPQLYRICRMAQRFPSDCLGPHQS